MNQDEATPKLHIDSDWKAEAQAEKERLTAVEESSKKADGATAGPGGGPGGPRELPEASFQTLVSVLASQALMGLGTMQDPDTKGVVVDLEGARFSIDLLSILEEKTEGNITADEAKELKYLLSELRSRFVQVTEIVAKQGTGIPPVAPEL